MSSPLKVIHSNWNHFFDNFQFSSAEFYDIVEEIITSTEIPDVKFDRIELSQGGLFSSKREYLRVSRKGFIFDIGATPFANGFYISWWLGEEKPGIFSKGPRLDTYYLVDTASMFKSSVHSSVMAAIEQITSGKGLRELSELERQFKETSGIEG